MEQELTVLIADLGPDERRVLLFVAQRLRAGQLAYGLLDVVHDARDWTREASEEIADMLVYLGAAALRRDLKRGPR